MAKKISGKKLARNDEQKGVLFEDVKRFADDRGVFINVAFEAANDVTFKRSYIITNNQPGVVRAFHGHKKEAKLFYVPQGAFKFIVMDMESNEWKEYVLSEAVPKILYVSPGYYNGFVSLTEDALLVTYSSSKMEESVKDDFRLPYDTLGNEVWSIMSR
ncbi:MAG: dTDP-4-dehydrorhamnose 3,5-epimerase family protein [Candidatus Diapherotrites archaeon]